MTRPQCKVVRVGTTSEGTYQLYSNGHLWTKGRHGFKVGEDYLPDSLEAAIDDHEEEMRIMLAEFV